MRQHDLSFANFVVRFGVDEVLLDYAEEIVVPAFLNDSHARRYGDTELLFYNTRVRVLGRDGDVPVVAITGHFVKDTKLRRQQIFREGEGLVANSAEIESAPSAFFVLLLNNHRLLYFAETSGAPSLQTFQATAQQFLKSEWHRYVREELARVNITRRGSERLTLRQIQRRLPPPRLAVVQVAGQDAITQSIERFAKITQLRLKLVEPNDETDASDAVAAVEESLRPLEPSRLEVIASQPKGLNKEEVEKAVNEVSEGQNTHIVVTGEDESGLKMQADNDEFALNVPIEEPPAEDASLANTLYEKYQELAEAGKVKGLTTLAKVVEKLQRIAQG